MKKITSLLMLFLVCWGTAWAQLPDGVKASTESNPIRYNLGSAGQNKGYYATVNPNGPADQSIGSAKTFTADKAKAAFIFVAVADGDATKGYKIKVEIGNQFYEVGLTADDTNGAEVKAQTTANFSTWKFVKKDDDGNKWALQYLGSDNQWKDGSWNMHGGAGNNLKTYQGNDQGSKWFCIEKDHPGFVEELANEKVYVLQSGRSNENKKEYLIYDADAPNNVSSTWGSGKTDYDRSKVANDPNAQWVLYKGKMGTYFYNVGAKKFVGKAANNGGHSPIPMANEVTSSSQVYDNGKVGGYHFILTTNGWTINVANIAQCHGVVSWGNYDQHTNDGGNCVKIIPVSVSTETVDLKAVSDQVSNFENRFLLDNLIKVQDTIQGCVDGLTATDFETLKTKKTLAEAEAFVNEHKIKLEAGKYYTLSNVFRKKDASTNGDKVITAEASNSNVNTVWKIEQATGNKFKIYSPNAQKYVPAPETSKEPILNETGAEYEISKLADGQYRLNVGNSNLVIYNTNSLGAWSNASKGGDGAWYIKPVTSLEVALHTVSTASYATAYLPFDIASVSGATAYIGKKESTSILKATPISNGIPANNGVILKGAANEQKAILTLGTATSSVEGNALSGTFTSKAWIGELVFGIADGIVGFYSMDAGDSIGANKAYLANAAAQAVKLMFDGEVTGIVDATENINNTDAPIYDLSGRRVMKTVKGGLYIQNRKKFIAH